MWEARFADGPLEEEDFTISFAVGEPFETMFLAPMPVPAKWVRVGDETLVPTEPWPGMVTYERALVFMLNGVLTGVYEQVPA